jgi:hypothetical protein
VLECPRIAHPPLQRKTANEFSRTSSEHQGMQGFGFWA